MMETPPRIRGLVDRLERAVRLHCYASGEDKPHRKHALNLARLKLFRAIAVIAGESPSERER